MAVEIPMPRLSQTTDEVKLIRWLVKEGDSVRKGQALCEVENDKTTMEVESFAAGTVLRLQGEPDTVIGTGAVIAVLGEPGEAIAAAPVKAGIHAGLRPGVPDGARAPTAGPSPAPMESTAQPAPATPPTGPVVEPPVPQANVRATPLVRNLARKHGVDLTRVRGTGAQGLITRVDLDDYLRGAGPAAPSGTPGFAAGPAAAQAPSTSAEPVEVPLTAHQRAVARAVTAAKTQIPHFYLKVRVGADRLLAWRQAHPRPDGNKVAVDAVLAWACARALVRHPRLNGTFAGERIRLEPEVHVGVAVAAGEELHVPVVRQAQVKDIAGIDRELAALAGKAQAGRLAGAEISGGTFTITNLGMYPVEEFTAVLNAPQLAILAAGSIARELTVAEDGSFRARSALMLTGSFDHRAVNGAQAAAFLAEVKRQLEEEL